MKDFWDSDFAFFAGLGLLLALFLGGYALSQHDNSNIAKECIKAGKVWKQHGDTGDCINP